MPKRDESLPIYCIILLISACEALNSFSAVFTELRYVISNLLSSMTFAFDFCFSEVFVAKSLRACCRSLLRV